MGLRISSKSSSWAGLLLVFGVLQPVRLDAQHLALGAGMSFADRGANELLGGRGFTWYGRISWRSGRSFSLVNDFWVISIPDVPIETPPCPGPQCAPTFTSNQTTVLVLAPALVARQGYEKASLLYRLGPTASWFANRPTGTPALAGGVQAGLSILTTRRQNGMLLSIDYLRMFRGDAHPRWFVPITVGWQF